MNHPSVAGLPQGARAPLGGSEYTPVPSVGAISQLGDARSGKLADNLSGFGRALRRAGVPVDASRMALAQQALLLVGMARDDMCAALEAVLVAREQDRHVFRELFAAYFRNPEIAQKLLAQMLPTSPEPLPPGTRRPRVADALAPLRAARQPQADSPEHTIELDAAMTASDSNRLRHADFDQLSAAEYKLVQALAREIPLPLPRYAGRRTHPGLRGNRPHWPQAMHRAARTGGELLTLPRLARRELPVPLLVLVDVSGSMERYARLLLTFVHAATAPGRHPGRCDVFALGTSLTPLGPAFRLADSDAMLAAAGQAIPDFAGGTRLGDALAQLRREHARCLIGRRTLVLLVSDGLDTGDRAVLAHELAWLRRHCGRLLWLNPLMRYAAYQPTAQGAAALHQHAHAMLAVHNLESLQQLARSIATLLRQPLN